MADRPILMSAPMVRALLDSTKTQTRRVAKGVNFVSSGGAPLNFTDDDIKAVSCPYGQPGDRLWVRETWQRAGGNTGYWYRATDSKADDGGSPVSHWRPSIFMPRGASRITLEVTGVRVERLQDISSNDAEAEGWPGPDHENSIGSAYPIAWYSKLWESINGPESWDANPWVWVVEFKRVTP